MPAQPLLVVAGELCRAFGVAAIFGSDLDDELIKKVTLPNEKTSSIERANTDSLPFRGGREKA